MPKVRRCVVIGLGLIGGSLALGLKRSGFCETVIGIDNSSEAINKGLSLGVIDSGYTAFSHIESELGQDDIVYIAVPTLAIPSLIQELLPIVEKGVTITDGASVKGSVITAFKSVVGYMPENVVPGHPIAGSENSGVTAASDTLYNGRRCILCPENNVAPEHLERVSAMWQSVGAEVHIMDASIHDNVFASTSHLPHIIAFALVDALAGNRHSADIFENAAGGFTGFTRIASSNPRMWKDISLANKTAIVETLDGFVSNLTHLRSAILADDGDYLESAFARAKRSRDKFLCAGAK